MQSDLDRNYSPVKLTPSGDSADKSKDPDHPTSILQSDPDLHYSPIESIPTEDSSDEEQRS